MTETKYPSHTLDKFQLRLPEGMRERIKEAAKESGRSMNAEIVYRLEESFRQPDLLDALNADPKATQIARDHTKYLEEQQAILDAEIKRNTRTNELMQKAIESLNHLSTAFAEQKKQTQVLDRLDVIESILKKKR
jgi:hypothetical protein